MKETFKNLVFLTIVLYIIIFLFIYNKALVNDVYNIILVWIKKIIPSLFPILIISDLIYNSNIPYYFEKIFHIPFVFLFSVITGSPTNAYIIDRYNADNTNILAVTNNISLLFLYNSLINIYNKRISLIIIFSSIIGNVILFFKYKVKFNINKSSNTNLCFELLKAIKRSINTVISILGILLFICFIPINRINNIYFKSFFYSILEVTSFFNYIKLINIDFGIKLLLTIICISSTGLCIQLQIASIITKDVNYKKYFLIKLEHLIIVLFTSYVFIELLC